MFWFFDLVFLEWFILPFVVMSILAIVCVEGGRYWLASFTAAAYTAFVWWKTPPFLKGHSWEVVAVILASYVVIGILWGVFRWILQVRAAKRWWDQNPTVRTSWSHLPKKYFGYKTWGTNLYKGDMPTLETVWPHPKNNKGNIYTWMILWPWSMAWYVLSDSLKAMYDAIYYRIADLLIAISKRTFGVK